MSFTDYLWSVGDCISQLLNNLLLFANNPNESISGRCYINRTKPGWKQARIAIDFVFSPIQEAHCEDAYYSDLERAHAYINRRDRPRNS